MPEQTTRPWVPASVETFYQHHAAECRQFAAADFRREVDDLLAAHERFMDRECINLYAGTNIPNPRARHCQAGTIGSRPSLGYPADKYETGMRYAEQLEILAVEILRRIFNCRYVECRVGSGSLANLYAYMACTKSGDRIMALPDKAAGHVTHHAAGAAGLYGLEVHDIPWADAQMTIDLAGLAREARRNWRRAAARCNRAATAATPCRITSLCRPEGSAAAPPRPGDWNSPTSWPAASACPDRPSPATSTDCDSEPRRSRDGV
jgi:glycine hydroxymethyltransferase